MRQLVELIGLLVREAFRVRTRVFFVKGKTSGEWYGWEER